MFLCVDKFYNVGLLGGLDFSNGDISLPVTLDTLFALKTDEGAYYKLRFEELADVVLWIRGQIDESRQAFCGPILSFWLFRKMTSPERWRSLAFHLLRLAQYSKMIPPKVKSPLDLLGGTE